MSLFKQMVIMLSLFFGIILISVMVLNFKSATEFVQNQLYTDAKNTAHSLGLSLSKVSDPSDRSTMETMINAIFDSGYYERIALKDIEGNVIYERVNDVRVHDIPQWFVDRVTIRNVTVKSEIMIGWNRFGTLEVSGHTGHAYRELYLTLIDLIQTFVMIGALVFGALYLLLSFSLKSLQRIRNQATAIIDNEFIIEKELPFTTEFRSAAMAMNAMVAKVKDIFDRENETLRRYHELLYKDPEINIHNRRFLTAKLPDYLHGSTELSSGTYVMLSFNRLDRFKKEHGYEVYKAFLIRFGAEVETELGLYRNTLITRLNESDFFIAVPSVFPSNVMPQAQEIMNRIRQWMDEIDEGIQHYLTLGCGIGKYGANDTLKSLFSRADHTVTQAKAKGNFAITLDENEHENLVLSHEEWRSELLLSLKESRMVLVFQSVMEYGANESKVLHEEVLLRLLDREGKIHCAGYFIPVATSLGLVDTLDRYTIEQVLSHFKQKNVSAGIAINLSGEFIKKYANIEWLRTQLETFYESAELPLWFEVSNAIAIQEIEALRSLSAAIKPFGCRLGIDHFVIPESGADYLQLIRPDYLKSNASYLLDMLLDKETGKTRESMNNLLKSLGISMVAIMVEENKQLEDLKELGVTRFQGSYVAPVAPLK